MTPAQALFYAAQDFGTGVDDLWQSRYADGVERLFTLMGFTSAHMTVEARQKAKSLEKQWGRREGRHPDNPLTPETWRKLARESETRQSVGDGKMKVTKKVAAEIMHDLGYKVAKNWSAKQLEQKVNALQDVFDDGDEKKVKNPANAKVLKNVLKALEAEEEIEVVVAAEEEAAEKPAKNTTKPKKTTEPTDEADEDEEDEEEKPAKKPAKGNAKKGLSITDVVVECLKKASAKKPTDAATIFKEVQRRLGKGSITTVKDALARDLKQRRNIEPQKNDKGYWLD